MQRSAPNGPKLPVEARAVAGVFGAIFASIGVLTIGWLWLQPFGNFGSPPVFFRLFGSLVAIGFVVTGGAALISALKGHGMPSDISEKIQGTAGPDSPDTTTYTCPRCGAPLAERADVSPHGDVKCTYCSTWFNVHQA